jgi:hypothetical protein
MRTRHHAQLRRNSGQLADAIQPLDLLARQSPERLNAIRTAIENGVRRYAKGNEFVIRMAAHIVVASK